MVKAKEPRKVKKLKTKATKKKPETGERAPRSTDQLPLALQDAMGTWLENNASLGPGDLRTLATLDALVKAEVRDTWTVMGRKLNRIQVMELIVDMMSERHPLLSLLAVNGMPKAKTVMVWMQDHKAFREAVAFAEKMRAMLLTDEALQIVDGSTAKTAFQNKIRADLRMKLAGALDPKKYGKRLSIDQGETGDNLNEDELWSRMKSILISHSQMFQERTGIKLEIPVQDAEVVPNDDVAQFDLDPATLGIQGSREADHA